MRHSIRHSPHPGASVANVGPRGRLSGSLRQSSSSRLVRIKALRLAIEEGRFVVEARLIAVRMVASFAA